MQANNNYFKCCNYIHLYAYLCNIYVGLYVFFELDQD